MRKGSIPISIIVFFKITLASNTSAWLILAVILNLVPSVSTAQNGCVNSDFEQSPAATITLPGQVNGWILHRSIAAVNDDNCNLASCCPANPKFSEILNTSSGSIDVLVGNIYPYYSVFGAGQTTAGLVYNPHLPMMGGNKIMRLNGFGSNGLPSEQATKTILVTPNENVLKFAYSVVMAPAHTCCQGPGFRLAISSSTCVSINTNACLTNSLAGFYEGLTGLPATNLSKVIYSKWKVQVLDLLPFMGQVVTVSLTASRCIPDAHDGYAFVDSECGNSFLKFNGTPIPNTNTVATYTTCNTTFTLIADPFFESYLWTGPNGFTSTNDTVIPTQVGSYTVELGQALCPPVIRVINVLQTPPVYVSSSGTFCAGQAVILTASGAASYTWQSPPSNSASVKVYPTTQTVYSVSGTMANNCTIFGTFTVNPAPNPNLNLYYEDTLCLGSSQSFHALGADYYEWLGHAGFYSQVESPVFHANSGLGLMTFTLNGFSNAGCASSQQFTVQVVPSSAASINISPSDTVCPGTKVVLTASGGKFYTWSGPFISSTDGPKAYLEVNQIPNAGANTVVAINEYGCRSSESILIHVIAPPAIYLGGDLSGCVPFCTTLNAIPGAGSNQIMTSWKTEGALFSGQQLTHCFQTIGEHKVHIQLEDLKTSCTASLSSLVNVYPIPIADFTTRPKAITEYTEETELINQSQGEEIRFIRWYAPYDVKLDTGSRSFVSFKNPGIYAIVLIVRNDWGCEDTVVKPLVVEEEPAIYIPDAFTPNGDGLNDVFFPVARSCKLFALSVFDRWGERIFVSQNVNDGWDGTFKGAECKPDLYTWTMTLTTHTNQNKEYKGHVSLIR